MILKFVDDKGNTAKVTLAQKGDRELVIKMMREKYGFRLVENFTKKQIDTTSACVNEVKNEA